LHYLLVQFHVFIDVPFNAFAIGLYFSPERLKLTNEIVIFGRRSRFAETLGGQFAITTLGSGASTRKRRSGQPE